MDKIFFNVVWKVVMSLCGRLDINLMVLDKMIGLLLVSLISCIVGFSVVNNWFWVRIFVCVSLLNRVDFLVFVYLMRVMMG